jgi:hypothetical protein
MAFDKNTSMGKTRKLAALQDQNLVSEIADQPDQADSFDVIIDEQEPEQEPASE